MITWRNGLPWWCSGKESASAGDESLILGSGRCLLEGNGNPLQCSCLGNPMDRGASQATVYGVVRELDTTEQLNKNNMEKQCSKLPHM